MVSENLAPCHGSCEDSTKSSTGNNSNVADNWIKDWDWKHTIMENMQCAHGTIWYTLSPIINVLEQRTPAINCDFWKLWKRVLADDMTPKSYRPPPAFNTNHKRGRAFPNIPNFLISLPNVHDFSFENPADLFPIIELYWILPFSNERSVLNVTESDPVKQFRMFHICITCFLALWKNLRWIQEHRPDIAKQSPSKHSLIFLPLGLPGERQHLAGKVTAAYTYPMTVWWNAP